LIINSNKQTTIALSNRVLVLNHGEIIAQGSHDELVASCEFYRELMGFQQPENNNFSLNVAVAQGAIS